MSVYRHSASSFFFLLLSASSGNTYFSHTSLYAFDFHQTWSKNQYLTITHTQKIVGSGVTMGSLGLKGYFHYKASSPSDYITLTRDLCIYSSLTPYKSKGPKNSSQVFFWLTGVTPNDQKALSLSDFVALTPDLCICSSWTPSSYCPKNSSGVILGHWGQKIISLKCYNLSMLQSMIIRITHVDQFETHYLFYEVTSQSGVIWGHWSPKVIFSKNAIIHPCCIVWP